MQGKKLFDTKGKAPVVGVRVRPETLDRLKKIGEKEELTVSDMLRVMAEMFVDDPRGTVEAIRRRKQGVAELKVMDSRPTKDAL